MSTQGRYNNRDKKSGGDMGKVSRHNFGDNWRAVLVPEVETIPLQISIQVKDDKFRTKIPMHLHPENQILKIN